MFIRNYQSTIGDIEISFAKPEEIEGRWFCEFQINSAGREEVKTKGWGVDALDSLLRSIDLTNILINNFRDEGIIIQWLGGDELGLSLRSD